MPKKEKRSDKAKEKKKPRKKPIHKITVFLLKDDAPKNEECITESALHAADVTISGNKGQVFIFRSQMKRPRWFNFLLPVLSAESVKHFTSSGRVSALLFLPIKIEKETKRFVFALGHGAHRLSDVTYETDFGRDACISSADTEKLLSIDEQQFKDQVWRVRRQATRSSGAASFEFDPYSVITRLTATAKDKTLGKRISGAESFVSNLPIEIADSPEVLSKIYKQYVRRPEATVAEWANRVNKVTDPALILALDSEIISLLKSNADGSDLPECSPPQVIDWDEAEKYALSGVGRGQEYDEWPDASTWVEQFDDNEITADYLKKCRVAIFGGEERKHSWNLYRCLSHQVQRGRKTYALANSNWYEINKNFIEKINRAIEGVDKFCPYKNGGAPRSKRAELEYVAGTKEGDYNEAAGPAMRAAVFDKKLVPYHSVSQGSTVEPCDILTRAGHFIHLKRYKGSSSLSHLFFQGSVSAECFSGDPSFRAFLIEKGGRDSVWIKNLLKERDFDGRNFNAVFGILSENGAQMSTEQLPIFARIALAQTLDTMKSLQMPVQIWMV